MNQVRYAAGDLIAFARRMLEAVGISSDPAGTTAGILVEGDLMGHSTHGLALLSANLAEIEAGRIAKSGEPTTLADRGAAVTWDGWAPSGGRLIGPWLVVRGLDLAAERAQRFGTSTVVIRRAGHIACLAAYLRLMIERGFVTSIYSSDPTVATVAPHGGIAARVTPDPMAFGWPTDKGPVLVDISASITTNGMTARRRQEGLRMPGPWLKDNKGQVTDDPNALFAEPPGTILPLGGVDAGHKGYGLALTIEALTSGLGGFGRADRPSGWGANVFLQVADPAAFGGRSAFERETGWLVDACRTTPVRPGDPPVRVPGDGAMARRAEQLKSGVALYPSIRPSLEPWTKKLGVAFPNPLN